MDEHEMGLPPQHPQQPDQPNVNTQWGAPPEMRPPARAPRQPRPRSARRWLLIGGGAAALLVALAVAVALGASALTARAAGLSDLHTTLASFTGATPQPGRTAAGQRAGHGPMRRGDLTVASVSGQTITAKQPDGTSVTITVSNSTQYTRAGKTVSLSAITAGETIHVMGQRNSNGAITATHIDIVLPRYDGQVTAISGSTITIKDRRGASHVIHTTASTTVRRAGQNASLSDIITGAQISAVGTKNSDGSLDAEAIVIVLPHAGGQIKSVSGSTLTLTDPRDSSATITIHVTASTRYVTVTQGSNGPIQSASSFSALKVGVFVAVEGTKNSDGSLTAEVVTILPNPPAGKPAPGGPMGGPGGGPGGPGGGPDFGPPPAGSTSAN